MFKCIAPNTQNNPDYIRRMIKRLRDGDESCESIRCVFKIKEDPTIYMWALIDLFDFPNFGKIFQTLELLEKLNVYEIYENQSLDIS